MIELRQEQPADNVAIRHLNLAAFNNGPEADLVDQLRSACEAYIAFVALDKDKIVGHIAFTPVTLDSSTSVGMGLAPMAVLPSQQRKGIGSALVRHSLAQLHEAGCPFVIVLGHAEYYPRFGFAAASQYNLRSQWEGVPDDVFRVRVFNEAALPAEGGVVRYRDEFNATL